MKNWKLFKDMYFTEDFVREVEAFTGTLDEMVANEATYWLGMNICTQALYNKRAHLLSDELLFRVCSQYDCMLAEIPDNRITSDLLIRLVRENEDENALRYLAPRHYTELVAKEIVKLRSSMLVWLPARVRTVSVISAALERHASGCFSILTDAERKKFGFVQLTGKEECFSEFPSEEGYSYCMLTCPINKNRYAIMYSDTHGAYHKTLKP